MRVLVADDDYITRKILTDTLTNLSCEVVTAVDGVEALEILQQPSAPQLVLLDWVMPGLEGIEVCQQLRDIYAKSEKYFYVIILTGKRDIEDIVEGIKAGADDYIVKPFNKDELQVRLRAGSRIVDLQNQLIAANRELKILAENDSLTGIMNRRSILAKLSEELARAQRQNTLVAVAMCDLDHFKNVNDTYGHDAGDAVLQESVKRFKHCLRYYDSVGRYGGEEFLIIVSGTSKDDFKQAFERIRNGVSQTPILVGQHNITVTVSIGVTLSINTYDPDKLLKAADIALYKAKEEGRNRIIYYNQDS